MNNADDKLKILSIKGKVTHGRGEGGKFIELPWVKKQITEKLGFIPFVGTLNIELTKKSLKVKNLLEKAEVTEILPLEGFYRGKCFKAYFMDNLKCAIIIPEVRNYPKDVLEIVAPVSLKEHFKLRDGDIVKVKVLL